jgi:hypothetical protein
MMKSLTNEKYCGASPSGITQGYQTLNFSLLESELRNGTVCPLLRRNRQLKGKTGLSLKDFRKFLRIFYIPGEQVCPFLFVGNKRAAMKESIEAAKRLKVVLFGRLYQGIHGAGTFCPIGALIEQPIFSFMCLNT